MLAIRAPLLLACALHLLPIARAQSPVSQTVASAPAQASASLGVVSTVASEAKQPQKSLEGRVTALEADVANLRSKSDQQLSPWIAAAAVVAAALIGGFFALRNQNRQAAQERLLKAVEIIMDSRNGYQADIRAKNLSVFLDRATRQHLESIHDSFSGPEYTDLRTALAESMSTKATSPTEVLAIWQAVLDDKGGITKVRYP